MNYGTGVFLFVEHTAAALEQLLSKEWMWYNVFRGNILPSMVESVHILSINNAPCQVGWVTLEYVLEGMTALLVSLWYKFHPPTLPNMPNSRE